MTPMLEWFPHISWLFAALVVISAIALLSAAIMRGTKALFWRSGFLILAVAALLNPVFMKEVRRALPDKLIVVVDDSASQKIAGRDAVAEKALKHIEENTGGAELIVLRSDPQAEGTSLFSVLQEALPTIPLSQVAGTVLITDGQVHDVPANVGALERLGPFHAVLTGKKNEFDRKLTVVSAPKYGVLNSDVVLSLKLEESGRDSGAGVEVTVLQDGKPQSSSVMTPGETQDFTFNISHPGQNVFEFSVPVENDELSAANNAAPVIVNGIRDRLRVLLVSGAPHMGERAWRNLLKSDPSIDLIHFTILRSPMSMDATPQSELALIVFPVDELFSKKINDFDLIIFDRYHQYGLLSQDYFANIASFVKNGGAFLMAMGGEDAEIDISATPIGELLPVTTGIETIKGTFTPQVTPAGKIHPVTSDIAPIFDRKGWGQWFSQMEATEIRGERLMTGAGGNPLLVLDKAGEGRVAVLSSDNIWLWSKGGRQAGPYTELLRNVAHWLMKEPELENGFLKAEVQGRNITVSLRQPDAAPEQVTLSRPGGATETVDLKDSGGGWKRATVKAEEGGIYSLAHGDKKAFAVVGSAANPEFLDVRTTEEKLAPIVSKSGGGTVWYQENPDFTLRGVSASARSFGGEGWIGLRRNGAYAVESVEAASFIPNWLALLLLVAGAFVMWRRESR